MANSELKDKILLLLSELDKINNKPWYLKVDDNLNGYLSGTCKKDICSALYDLFRKEYLKPSLSEDNLYEWKHVGSDSMTPKGINMPRKL